MRLKFSGLAILLFLAGELSARAQVAPSARVGGIPLGISFGISRYYLDYGPGRYMEGAVFRAGAPFFHGFGLDVSARSIFMFTPESLTRMQQTTYLAGVFYESRPFRGLRAFGRFGGGLGTIEFSSTNPFYTTGSSTVYAPSGGFEYPIVDKVYLRGEYEYQFWKNFQGPNFLNPRGVTLGVTYYLRGYRVRPHPIDRQTP
jgi:hypothetical protein